MGESQKPELKEKLDVSNHFLVYYIAIAAAISAVSIFFGYSFDESVLAGYAANFYYYSANPFFNWAMGLYYLGINIGGYFPSVILNIFGVQNVLVEELGVKIPIDVAVFISGLLVYRILLNFNVDKRQAELGAFAYLLSPLLFFYAPFHGNPLDVTLMFLLAFVFSLQNGRYYLASIFLGIATSSYLYPVFIFPFFIFLLFKKSNLLTSSVSIIIYIIVSGLGVGVQFIANIVTGLPLFFDTSFSGGSWAGLSGFGYLPPESNALYFIRLFHGLSLPYYISQVVFILVMLLPVVYLIIKRRKLQPSIPDLIYLMAFQGLVFAIFATQDHEQYLLASLPFILLIVFLTRRVSLMYLLYTMTLFGILMIAYVTSYNFSAYYVDVNRSASRIVLLMPENIFMFLSIAYSALGIALMTIIMGKIFNGKWKPRVISINKRIRAINWTSGVSILVFLLISFIIISPGFSHLPQEFSYQVNSPGEQVSVTFFHTQSNNPALTFQPPADWAYIPEYVKENSPVGLYLIFTPAPAEYGVIGYNDLFPFNSSHFIGESFYVPSRSQLQFSIVFINDSYKYATVYLVKGTNLSNENIIASFSNINNAIYSGSYPGTNIMEYLSSFQVNKMVPPGLYSVIVAGNSNITGYLGGWNGDPSTQNIQDIFVIGKGSQIVPNTGVPNMRFSLVISAYFYGYINATMNGEHLKFLVNGTSVVEEKIPPYMIRANNTLIFSNSYINFTSPPRLYYYIPFPFQPYLISMNPFNFVVGAIIFIFLCILFEYAVFDVLLPPHLRKNIKGEKIPELKK